MSAGTDQVAVRGRLGTVPCRQGESIYG